MGTSLACPCVPAYVAGLAVRKGQVAGLRAVLAGPNETVRVSLRSRERNNPVTDA